MELLSKRDIAANLYPSLHVRGDQVSLTFNDFDKILLITADRAVGIVRGLLDLDGAVVYRDEPASDMRNLKQIGSVNTAQNRLVLLHPVNAEYLLGGAWPVE